MFKAVRINRDRRWKGDLNWVDKTETFPCMIESQLGGVKEMRAMWRCMEMWDKMSACVGMCTGYWGGHGAMMRMCDEFRGMWRIMGD